MHLVPTATSTQTAAPPADSKIRAFLRWFLGTDRDASESSTYESLVELGIEPRTGWYIGAVLYFIGGVIFVTLWAVAGIVPMMTGVLGAIAILLAGVFVIGGTYFPNAPIGAHMLIGCGLAIITYGAFVDGNKHSAFALLMMWPVLVPVYLFTPSLSMPYLIAGTVSCVVTLLAIVDPTAYAIVTGMMFAAIGLTTVAAQHELRLMSRINRDLAVTDPLTGVANMRRLMERMRDAIAIAGRGGEPVALFALDLDDFKQVNDRFGHGRGDELLRAVADSVSEAVDPGDLVARRGGDEFAVLTVVHRDRDLDETRVRIEQAVRRAREQSCPQVTTTASVGYVVSEAGESPPAMLARADAQLHNRKLEHHGVAAGAIGATAGVNDSELAQHRERLEQRGPAHQTSHAMSGTDAEVQTDLAMARSIKRVLGHTLSWEMIAGINAAMAVAVVGAMLTATGNELVAPLPIVATAGLAWLAGMALLASRGEAGHQSLHVVIALTVVCVTAIVFSADATRASMVDLYLGPMVCAFYSFPSRRAFIYYWACFAFYTAALVTADYGYLAERIGMTLSVTLVMVVMLGRARRNVAGYTVNAVKLSVIDPLTGAVNVRGLRRAVVDSIERCVGGEMTPALIAVDLDEFKLVNDRFGHSVGDRMLKAVTNAMRESLRAGDHLARRGGDEFAAVCLVNGAGEANALATRLADQIAKTRVELCPTLRPTATVGVVLWLAGEDADAFLARADNELHGAKVVSHAEREVERSAASA